MSWMRKKMRDVAAISVEMVIGVAVAALVFIAMAPGILNGFNTTVNYTAAGSPSGVGWFSGASTLYTLLPILFLVAILYAFYRRRM